MITDKHEKELLRVGLKLRDQLGGHHFLQIELGGGTQTPDGKFLPKWQCRDCGIEAVLDSQAWRSWVRLVLESPDSVREVLIRRDC